MTEPSTITVRVPLKIRRRPGRKTVVTSVQDRSSPSIRTQADPALMKALARAFRYQKLLDEGRYASISEMAKAERIERGYLGSILRLTLLAPDIVEALLDNRASEGPTLPDLLDPFDTGWPAQRRALFCKDDGAAGAGVTVVSTS